MALNEKDCYTVLDNCIGRSEQNRAGRFNIFLVTTLHTFLTFPLSHLPQLTTYS